MDRAVFLDRDGVIIENRDDYVKSWDEVRFLPGALEALSKLAQSPYQVLVVTNQSAVGRGILSRTAADEINKQMLQTIERAGGRIDKCYLCPHHPEAGCGCRKPSPGLLLQARRELALDLEHSFLIGDALTDLQAARAVGVEPLLVRTGRGGREAEMIAHAEIAVPPIVSDLPEAVDYIWARQLAPSGDHKDNRTWRGSHR